MKSRLIIADDHAILRQGLRDLISRTDDLEVVAQAAEQGLKQVRMGVDQAGHDGVVCGVEPFYVRVARQKIGVLADVLDAVAFDQYGTVTDDAPFRVHGDDAAIGDE